jgi:hypothetical protein
MTHNFEALNKALLEKTLVVGKCKNTLESVALVGLLASCFKRQPAGILVESVLDTRDSSPGKTTRYLSCGSEISGNNTKIYFRNIKNNRIFIFEIKTELLLDNQKTLSVEETSQRILSFYQAICPESLQELFDPDWSIIDIRSIRNIISDHNQPEGIIPTNSVPSDQSNIVSRFLESVRRYGFNR